MSPLALPRFVPESSSFSLKVGRELQATLSVLPVDQQGLEGMRAKARAFLGPDHPVLRGSGLHHMTAAELRGVSHLAENHGVETTRGLLTATIRDEPIPILGMKPFEVVLQLAAAAAYSEHAETLLGSAVSEARHTSKTTQTRRRLYSSGVFLGAYHALSRVPLTPEMTVEPGLNRIGGKVSFRRDRKVRKDRSLMAGKLRSKGKGRRFDYYTPENSTGHEIKKISRDCSKARRGMDRDERTNFLQQLAGYLRWLSDNQQRRLAFHILGNVPLNMLYALGENTSRFAERIDVHIYSPLNYFCPVQSYALATADPKKQWQRYYQGVCRVDFGNGHSHGLRAQVTSELSEEISRVKGSKDAHFTDKEILLLFDILHEVFPKSVSKPFQEPLRELIELAKSQWQDLVLEDLDEESTGALNEVLVDFFDHVKILLQSPKPWPLFRFIGKLRSFLIETRSYNHLYEELGIFAPTLLQAA